MRSLLVMLAVAAAVYALLGLLLYLFQGSMVFLANLPGRGLDATPGDIGLAWDDVSVVVFEEKKRRGEE